MGFKNHELETLQRKVIGSWRSITSNNCLWVSNDREAEYLISGHATELIEKIWLPCVYDNETYLKIYGVVAADRSEGRYVWIYVHYRHHIWKAHSIRHAYEIENKIKHHNKLEQKKYRMQRRLESRQKLIPICKN